MLSTSIGMMGNSPSGLSVNLPNNIVNSNSCVDTIVGMLSVRNGRGEYTFKITDDCGGRFRLNHYNSAQVEVAAALTVGTMIIVIRIDNGVDPTTKHKLSIMVI